METVTVAFVFAHVYPWMVFMAWAWIAEDRYGRRTDKWGKRWWGFVFAASAILASIGIVWPHLVVWDG